MIKIKPCDDYMRSCDQCGFQGEGERYCLLHGITVLNMNVKTCGQWSEKDENDSNFTNSCSYLDDLCQKMLYIGAFAPGTAEMTASEIKERLLPFFGRETLDRAVSVVCGKNNPAPSGNPFLDA